MVQPCCFDCYKVFLCNPGIPMILQHTQGIIRILHLSERVLVYNVRIIRVLEDTWSYPGLNGDQLALRAYAIRNVPLRQTIHPLFEIV